MKLMKKIIYPLLSVTMIIGILSDYDITKLKAQSTSSTQPMELVSATKTAPDYNRVVDVSSKEARMAVLAEDTLEMAVQLPNAAWNSLPRWNGVTVPNMQGYGFEYDGQPQVFIREDMENISNLGFNFVRVPLDTRLFFDLDDPSKVNLEKLVNLDELVSWGAEFGIHICIDVHCSFGFTTDEDNYNDTLWENLEEQELFLTFWDMLAERYKKLPSNLLSFNLMNEPNQGLDEEVYADLMRRAMERIRAYTPNRLIFVDMLNTARDPVYSLAEDKVAQSFHFYEPGALTGAGLNDDFEGGYPVFTGKGFISKNHGSGDFVIEGNFPAGTKIRFFVDEINKGGTLCLTADEKEIFSNKYGFDTVGENGCIYIHEEGTVGEYRGYNKIFTAELPENASVLRLYVKGDTNWFSLRKLQISTGNKQYLFEQSLAPLPEGIDMNEIPNPHIIIDEDGNIKDDEDILFNIVDASYINNRFAEYKAFSDETGVAVMLQEFGVYYTAPYAPTLEYLNDLLDAANANGLNWCGWDYFGPFSFYQVVKDRLREDAAYKKFSYGWIATEMLEIFQKHLTQSKAYFTKTYGAKQGTIFTFGSLKYQITTAAKITAGKITNGKVQVVGLSAAGKKKASVSIGTSIKHKANGQNATYTISSVATGAFKGAAKLKNITLSKNIKSIKKDTFKNCKNLATVNCKSKLSSVAKNSFKGCTKTITVKGTSKAANKKLLQKKNPSVKFK